MNGFIHLVGLGLGCLRPRRIDVFTPRGEGARDHTVRRVIGRSEQAPPRFRSQDGSVALSIARGAQCTSESHRSTRRRRTWWIAAESASAVRASRRRRWFLNADH